MKKNKTVAYMLAATLLVGGTFLGTKALFTDKVDAAGELAISTGDVDIEVVSNIDWKLDRNGAELRDGTNVTMNPSDEYTGEVPAISGGEDNIEANKVANNLKPGDKLVKTITVQNQGTLVAKLDLTSNQNIQSKLGALSGLITADGDINYVDGDQLLMPGEKASIELTLTVNDKGGDHIESNLNNDKTITDTNKGYNADDIENHHINLKEAWILTATQQNEK